MLGMYFQKNMGGTALHYANACRHMHGRAGPYISMQAPDTTGVVPNVTIVTPELVALTNSQRLSNREQSVNSPVYSQN